MTGLPIRKSSSHSEEKHLVKESPGVEGSFQLGTEASRLSYEGVNPKSGEGEFSMQFFYQGQEALAPSKLCCDGNRGDPVRFLHENPACRS